MRSQTTRTIAGRSDQQSGVGYTVRTIATGIYGVTFPGSRLVSMVSVPNNSTAAITAMNQSPLGGDGTTVHLYNAAGGHVDGVFHFTAAVAA